MVINPPQKVANCKNKMGGPVPVLKWIYGKEIVRICNGLGSCPVMGFVINGNEISGYILPERFPTYILKSGCPKLSS
jgi:hypothetical protein